MSGPIPTTVIRHPKERIQKCSLRFLHDRAELTFLRARPGFTFDATGFTLLAVDGAPRRRLTPAGRCRCSTRPGAGCRRCHPAPSIPIAFRRTLRSGWPRA